MGRPEIQKWIYRFIIYQIIFLNLETSESVPVWTIVLPAWILNTLFQFTVEIYFCDSCR